MENILNIVGAIITLIGSMFLFLGSLGLVRMPDIYNRIQTGTKASTLGTLLTLLGILIIMPEWWGRLILLMIFVLITNPVSSHVLARAAYFIGTPLTKGTVVDKLEYKYENKDIIEKDNAKEINL
ncbi:MAG: monovalent cation/H(+) antiporter subunit G [Bacteroidales bacterium]|jgi:multicomponent Na+:H+ antiporter subunit G|nr:monovalent cation/H(+) antiporter subunit G [Bacteroidales bacterium]